MSGEARRYEVAVLVKGVVPNERWEYRGGGRYNGLGELSRIWQLMSIDGAPVPDVESERQIPTVEFAFAGRGMRGNGGCNRFNGEVTRQEMTVTPGNLVVTRMACPNLATEGSYLKVLGNRTHQVDFDGDRMRLTSDGGVLEYVLMGADEE